MCKTGWIVGVGMNPATLIGFVCTEKTGLIGGGTENINKGIEEGFIEYKV